MSQDWKLEVILGSHQEAKKRLSRNASGEFCVADDSSQIHNVGILAKRKGRIIGRMCGCIASHTVGVFYESGFTFVSKNWRKKGLAMAMWRLMLETINPSTVNLRVISDRGLTLVERLQNEFKHIRFFWHDDGNRKLRLLKKNP